MFDPEIEQTTCRNNTKTRNTKLIAKKQDLVESFVSKTETMADIGNNNNNNNIEENANKNNNNDNKGN